MTRHALSLVVMVLLGGAGGAFAQDPVESWDGTITARTLNVRAGPATSHDIVGRLKRGDSVVAFDAEGRWIHIRGFEDSGKTGWISRAFVRLPEDFMAPAFGDIENAFLEWASARGDLAELSIEADDRLSLVLDGTVERAAAPAIAREVACAYREQLSLDAPVTAVVWPAEGPQDGWTAKVTCP